MLPRTQRQKEVLDYITRFHAKHGHEPSYAQIARYFGVSSKATIAKHISALEKRDYDVFSRRVRLSKWHKLMLALQALPVRWGWM